MASEIKIKGSNVVFSPINHGSSHVVDGGNRIPDANDNSPGLMTSSHYKLVQGLLNDKVANITIKNKGDKVQTILSLNNVSESDIQSSSNTGSIIAINLPAIGKNQQLIRASELSFGMVDYTSNSEDSCFSISTLVNGTITERLTITSGSVSICSGLSVDGVITAGGGNSTNWNTAYSTGIPGYSSSLYYRDNRIICPSEDSNNRLRFGFTTWNNNGNSPYADYLHLRSYGDCSGGKDNLIMFKKTGGIGMRIWQQDFYSTNAYATYVDVWTTDDFSSTNVTNWNNAHSHVSSTSNPHNVSKSDVGLGRVENTALSNWAGTTSITTLGTVATGTWNGSAIADGYISSATTWNDKQDALTFGIANNNAVCINANSVADDDYAKFTSSGLEGRTTTQLKIDASLDNVPNQNWTLEKNETNGDSPIHTTRYDNFYVSDLSFDSEDGNLTVIVENTDNQVVNLDNRYLLSSDNFATASGNITNATGNITNATGTITNATGTITNVTGTITNATTVTNATNITNTNIGTVSSAGTVTSATSVVAVSGNVGNVGGNAGAITGSATSVGSVTGNVGNVGGDTGAVSGTVSSANTVTNATNITNTNITTVNSAATVTNATTVTDADTVSNIGNLSSANVSAPISVDGNNKITIANGAIVNAKLANKTITASKIADTTITADKIANTTITAAKIANTTITAAKITDDTITNAKLAGSIANDKLTNSSVIIIAGDHLGGGSTTSSPTALGGAVTIDHNTTVGSEATTVDNSLTTWNTEDKTGLSTNAGTGTTYYALAGHDHSIPNHKHDLPDLTITVGRDAYGHVTSVTLACHSEDTYFELVDGGVKKAKNLEKGDKLKSISFNMDGSKSDISLITDSGKFSNQDMFSNTFKTTVSVKGISKFYSEGIYLINKKYELTGTHPVLSTKSLSSLLDCFWSWTRVKDLQVGDFLFAEDFDHQIITSVEFYEGLQPVVQLDVEEEDVYFCNGILHHNK